MPVASAAPAGLPSALPSTSTTVSAASTGTRGAACRRTTACSFSDACSVAKSAGLIPPTAGSSYPLATTSTSRPSERRSSSRRGEALARTMRERGTRLTGVSIVEVTAGVDVATFVAPAWIAVRPMDNAAERIVFILTLHDHVLTAAERKLTGEVGVCLDAHDELATGAERQEKTLVRADAAGLRSQNARDGAVG